jgi:hypothetical protein
MEQTYLDVNLAGDIFRVSKDRTSLEYGKDPSKSISFSDMERLQTDSPMVLRRFLYDPRTKSQYAPDIIPPTLPAAIKYVEFPDLLFLNPRLGAKAFKEDPEALIKELPKVDGRAVYPANEIPRTEINGKQYHLDSEKMEFRRVNNAKDTIRIDSIITLSGSVLKKIIEALFQPPPRPPRRRDGEDPNRSPGGPGGP